MENSLIEIDLVDFLVPPIGPDNFYFKADLFVRMRSTLSSWKIYVFFNLVETLGNEQMTYFIWHHFDCVIHVYWKKTCNGDVCFVESGFWILRPYRETCRHGVLSEISSIRLTYLFDFVLAKQSCIRNILLLSIGVPVITYGLFVVQNTTNTLFVRVVPFKFRQNSTSSMRLVRPKRSGNTSKGCLTTQLSFCFSAILGGFF